MLRHFVRGCFLYIYGSSPVLGLHLLLSAAAPHHRLKWSEHDVAPAARRQQRQGLVKSCPSGAAAVAPTAPVAAAAGAAGGALTIGSVAIVAGTLLIFVLIGAGLVFLHYVLDARRDDDRGRRRRGAQASRRRGGSGVDPDVLRSLPVTVYRAGAPPGSEKDAAVECAVCLAELEDGAAARFLPRCGHGFHAACVDAWLACHVTCPLCRLAVVAKPDASFPPPASALLPAAPPEPANYAANMPASVLLGVSDQGAVSI